MKNGANKGISLTGLIARGASATGYKPSKYLSKAERAKIETIEKLAEELDNLNLAIHFTAALDELGHPNTAHWILEVFNEAPIVGEKNWKQQIHQFATHWITYLTLIHSPECNTLRLRMELADERDPLKWLSIVTQVLAPFVVNNKLLMTEEQRAEMLSQEMKKYDNLADGAEGALSHGLSNGEWVPTPLTQSERKALGLSDGVAQEEKIAMELGGDGGATNAIIVQKTGAIGKSSEISDFTEVTKIENEANCGKAMPGILTMLSVMGLPSIEQMFGAVPQTPEPAEFVEEVPPTALEAPKVE